MGYPEVMDKAYQVRDAAVAAYRREWNTHTNTGKNAPVPADHALLPPNSNPMSIEAISGIPEQFRWLADREPIDSGAGLDAFNVIGAGSPLNAVQADLLLMPGDQLKGAAGDATYRTAPARATDTEEFAGKTADAFARYARSVTKAAQIQELVRAELSMANQLIDQHVKNRVKAITEIADKTVKALDADGGSFDLAMAALGGTISVVGALGSGGLGVSLAIAGAATGLAPFAASGDEPEGPISGSAPDEILASMTTAIDALRTSLESQESRIAGLLYDDLATLREADVQNLIAPRPTGPIRA